MSGETLLNRAIYNYKQALKVFKYSTGDERDMNFVGYLLQQCTELSIKHFLEVNGIRYSHTHSIEDLLDECDKNNVFIQYSEEFYLFSPAISKWESKTRYIKDYILSKRQVIVGFKLIKEFLISNGVKEQELKLPEIQLQDISAF